MNKDKDYAFEMAVSNVRFGVGVTREVGADLQELGARTVLVLTDPTVARLPPAQAVVESLELHGLEYVVYDRVRIEPSDQSFLDAIEVARARPFDAFVAVGGGSTIDTAKAANLYATYPPADFLDYVNPPIGKGQPVPGPLKPLIAIPTTAGTGSETTGVAIFDLQRMHAKTGIAHRRLRPTLGDLDPDNTRTMPPRGRGVDRAGRPQPRDRVVHGAAVRPAAPRPNVPACGPPIRARTRSATSGRCRRCAWSRGCSCARSTTRRTTRRAREMLLAASYAGIGFGNAGVHLPHGMSYPVSGMVHDVSRARLRDRSSAGAARHVGDPQCARGLPVHGAGQSRAAPAGRGGARARTYRARSAEDAGKVLADRITWFMHRLNMPNGLRALGYSSSDIPSLVEGTLPQHRVTQLSPRPAGPEELGALFEDAMVAW